jgi:trehalose-6-phosphate synthase
VYRTLEMSELLELYAAADVMAVTPYRDGLNLIAKEFVAARVDESGVLLLSEFAGVAEEFKDAVLVNPYSMSDLVEGMATALRMSHSESQTRMKSLRATVHSHTLSDWTDTFVEQLTACGR